MLFQGFSNIEKFVDDAECIAELIGSLWTMQNNKRDVDGFKENMSVVFNVASEGQPSRLERTPAAVAALIQHVPGNLLGQLLQAHAAQLASVFWYSLQI